MSSEDIALAARALEQRRASGSELGDWQLAETALAFLIAVWGDPSKLGGTKTLADGTLRQNPLALAVSKVNGRTPDAVVLKVMNLRSVWTGGRRGMPAASAVDRQVVARYAGHLDQLLADCTLIEESVPSARGIVNALVPPAIAAGGPTDSDAIVTDAGDEVATMVKVEILRRRGQNVFRARVLSNFAYTCGFCGLRSRLPEDNSYLLIASHIRPWSEASNHQRLDPSNGLSLCAIHDRAFEWGFLTLDEELNVVASEHAGAHYAPDDRVRSEILDLHGHRLRRPEANFLPPAAEYLDFHRSQIFERRFRRGA